MERGRLRPPAPASPARCGRDPLNGPAGGSVAPCCRTCLRQGLPGRPRRASQVRREGAPGCGLPESDSGLPPDCFQRPLPVRGPGSNPSPSDSQLIVP